MLLGHSTRIAWRKPAVPRAIVRYSRRPYIFLYPSAGGGEPLKLADSG